MDNNIKPGEKMSMASFYIGVTCEWHRIDGILWQDDHCGLWQFQNHDDLGLVDYAEDGTPFAIQYTIALPNGNVVAIVDFGCNSIDPHDGGSFPQVYADMLDWDARHPEKEEK